MARAPKYDLDDPPGVFKERVFVGGSFNHMAILEEIYKAVLDCGFTPIFSPDFGIPVGTTRHSAKRLVQHCKYAIFETSFHSGHYFEMVDAENFSCVTLCLWQASQNVGEMPETTDMFKANNEPYRDISELRSHVYDFLGTTN